MENIIAILCDYTETDPEHIQPASRLVEDLGLTSLDLLDAVTAFEEAYGLEITDEDIKKMRTVQDIADYIQLHA